MNRPAPGGEQVGRQPGRDRLAAAVLQPLLSGLLDPRHGLPFAGVTPYSERDVRAYQRGYPSPSAANSPPSMVMGVARPGSRGLFGGGRSPLQLNVDDTGPWAAALIRKVLEERPSEMRALYEAVEREVPVTSPEFLAAAKKAAALSDKILKALDDTALTRLKKQDAFACTTATRTRARVSASRMAAALIGSRTGCTWAAASSRDPTPPEDPAGTW
ncbi:hypothetical protein SMD20_47825 [Nonomuraea sp. LP-02]|uniref:hypothetical protein n=1 Tax=Nonomuraea sp. LP-02 TaxID=3097960 RepID=UPI002E310CA5|nr:hypothetical protein [Nonomuraea sp. LP-02]MED7932002.1 hypothetical protein [Nonomuraea sp. LP-02]